MIKDITEDFKTFSTTTGDALAFYSISLEYFKTTEQKEKAILACEAAHYERMSHTEARALVLSVTHKTVAELMDVHASLSKHQRVSDKAFDKTLSIMHYFNRKIIPNNIEYKIIDDINWIFNLYGYFSESIGNHPRVHYENYAQNYKHSSINNVPFSLWFESFSAHISLHRLKSNWGRMRAFHKNHVAMNRNVLAYIKQNPSFITQE